MFRLSAQSYTEEQERYQGNYKINGYSGKADYQYLISGTDTIFHGVFQMQRSSLDALLQKEDASFSFKGHFENGVAEGDWQFQFGEFQSDSESKLVGYEYRVLISGIQEEGGGAIKDGRPDGTWTYEVNRIKESEIQQTLFKSTFNYLSGVPQQSFQIENDHSILVGRFLRSGLAHDEWSSYALDAVDDLESWYFEEGALKSIKVVKDGLTNKVDIFQNLGENYKEITLDERFGEVVEATMKSNGNSLGVNAVIANLLAQNRGYYQKMDTVLTELGSSDFLPKSKVKVPYFELNDTQKAHLKVITTDFLVAESVAEKLLNNTHLNIVRRSDTDAQYYYDLANLISETYLKPLSEIVRYNRIGITSYLNIPKLAEALWPNGKPSTTLILEGNAGDAERSFSLPNAQEFNFEDGLNGLRQMTSYAKLSLLELKDKLAGQLLGEERTQALNGLEEELIAMNEVLVQQVDSVGEKLSEQYKLGLKNILKLADSSLITYASLKDSEEKLSYGTRLKSCLAQLKFLTAELETLPAQEEQIKTLYTDAIWNPFMATVMEEEVKKRITSAYLDQLIPHFLKTVETRLDCENVKTIKEQMINANLRMEELREENTRKLERKLRRVKNPEEVLELFFSNSNEKEAQ